MTEFVETAVKGIDERLRELRDEVSRLEAARTALAGERRRAGRPRGSRNGHASRARTTRSTTTPRRTRRARRGSHNRAARTLELVREQPGITIPELGRAMKIQPNYLYRLLPRLESEGKVRRQGQGWRAGAK